MSAVPVWVALWLVHIGLIDLMFPSEPACGADFQKLSCTAKVIRGWREALTQSSEAVGFRLYQREHKLVPVLARAPRTQRVPTGGPPPSPSKEALSPHLSFTVSVTVAGCWKFTQGFSGLEYSRLARGPCACCVHIPQSAASRGRTQSGEQGRRGQSLRRPQ